ncbi:MAG: Uma2 family endonuclease [Candidatus Omnitrophota bacterium]|jgi:Uma2 family endonuclease|nr:MAG: Uma2 family endonuclease [Candidatus Omnitrophota bacterium]
MPATIETIVESILQSPKLPQVVDKLKESMEDEQRRRQQFIEEIREDQKAEFINGEIIFHSPTKLRHLAASKSLVSLLNAYVQIHHLGFVGIEKMMISLTRNDYEPDISFFGKEKAQYFNGDQMRFPAPDFVVEILSPSTEKVDRGVKFEDYAAHGVQEYWMIDADTQVVEQYVLKDDGFELNMKSDSGLLKSVAVQGFTIPVRALFDQDENLRCLKEILQS